MAASLEAAQGEAQKVVKKQKVCEGKVNRSVQDMIDLVTQARSVMSAGGEGGEPPEAVLAQLRSKLASDGPLSAATDSTKDLHSAVGKLGKALDKAMDMDLDICKAMRDVQPDEASMSLVVAEHFYREGRFDVGDLFAEESHIELAASIKQPYVAMHSVLDQIRAKNLQPALDWATEHQNSLSPDGEPSTFEFQLQSLNFVSLLKEQGRGAALAYAKQRFERYQVSRCPSCTRILTRCAPHNLS